MNFLDSPSNEPKYNNTFLDQPDAVSAPQRIKITPVLFPLLETSGIANQVELPSQNSAVERPMPVLQRTPTIPLGVETQFFNKLCDVLENAFKEWRASPSDKENGDREVLILDVPLMSEFVVFGLRQECNQYLEGAILIQPRHTYVIKLFRNGNTKESICGVYIGEIEKFLGFRSTHFLWRRSMYVCHPKFKY
jgi:hypothetical protein